MSAKLPLWYAGKVKGAKCDEIVGRGKVGTFAVRESESKPGSFTFVLNTAKKVLSFKIRYSKGLFFLADCKTGHPTMDELIAYHRKNNVTGSQGTFPLGKPSPFIHAPFVGRKVKNVTANGSHITGTVITESKLSDGSNAFGFRADGQQRVVHVPASELVPDIFVPMVLFGAAGSSATLGKARKDATVPRKPNVRSGAPPPVPNTPRPNIPVATDLEMYAEMDGPGPVAAEGMSFYTDMDGPGIDATDLKVLEQALYEEGDDYENADQEFPGVVATTELIYEDGDDDAPPPLPSRGATMPAQPAPSDEPAPALPPPRRT